MDRCSSLGGFGRSSSDSTKFLAFLLASLHGVVLKSIHSVAPPGYRIVASPFLVYS